MVHNWHLIHRHNIRSHMYKFRQFVMIYDLLYIQYRSHNCHIMNMYSDNLYMNNQHHHDNMHLGNHSQLKYLYYLHKR
jgi:hypothetical protein